MKLIASAFMINDEMVIVGTDGFGWSGGICTDKKIDGYIYENPNIPRHMIGEFNMPGLSNRVIVKAKHLDTFYHKLERKINQAGGFAYTMM